MPDLKIRIAKSFDDPVVDRHLWNSLLARGPTNTVNLTWEWQRNWWDTFGRGQLLLVRVERAGEVVCIVPLFAQNEMVFNICPEDHLDFVGNANYPGVMEAILQTIREFVPRFQGMRLYFIPETSQTTARLQHAAQRVGLDSYEETWIASPRLDIAGDPAAANACTRKKSLVRHENFFRRNGHLDVRHFATAEEILPHLDDFFEQHVTRRAVTPQASIFVDPVQREYYRRIVATIGPTGWLRFTRIDWNGHPVAFHLGLSYDRRFLFGVSSFAIELQRRSPGEVLLRQLIQAAIAEKADIFDLGIGDEPYKYRFATSDVKLVTWGLYPQALLSAARRVQ